MPEQERQPMVCSQAKRQVNQGLRNGKKRLVRLQSPRRRRSCASSANEMPDSAQLPRMLEGITAADDGYLQRQANSLERRMFRRRVSNPAKTSDELRSALRRAGWVRVGIEWFGTSSLRVKAEIGARLRAKLSDARVLSADKWLFGDFIGAARKVGLRPGIEDISVNVEGQRLEASLSAVPLADMSAVLDRVVERWCAQDRAKSVHARKGASAD